MDFLADSNLCGQTLIRLVSRGNAIIAELLRLSDFIPSAFRLDTKKDQLRYGEVIADFSYFTTSVYLENKIEMSPELQDIDDELRTTHLEILTRFYLAFESIHKYITDLNQFLEDLKEYVFIHQTLETVMLAVEGKQLACEALYLYGVMLMVVDNRIPGPVRERMLVSFNRYTGKTSVECEHLDEVCKLLRSTGYTPPGGGTSAKRPTQYPEAFFQRIPIADEFTSVVIGRLSSDDIYGQIASFPAPEHRSTALATQAAMLYVVLYFSPETMHSNTSKMREIVDKHFNDNWVLAIYMGIPINLVEAWEPYKAAKAALNNNLEASTVNAHCKRHSSQLEKKLVEVKQYLKAGALTEKFVLDKTPKLLNTLRNCNVTLRWLILHTVEGGWDHHKRCKQLREQVITETAYQPQQVFLLLLNTAQLELNLKEMFRDLLEKKQSKWDHSKKECVERMMELSEVYSGVKPLTRISKNDKLQAWFATLATQIDSLDYDHHTDTGVKITHLIEALAGVQEYHQIEDAHQVLQYLRDTQTHLNHMIRVISIKQQVLITIAEVGDLSYCWETIDSYTDYMQQAIKATPSVVIKLRATFLKLASALDLPLVRLSQCQSDDLKSVSQYYSGELVIYVRKVLQIIPEQMFSLLAQIIHIQTHKIVELPTRLDKDKLKELSQLDERYLIAKLTHAISVLTEGMMMMKTTLVGVIKVDPKQLLEDGIRKELVRQVAAALHSGLIFNPRSKVSELESKLSTLRAKMDGFRRSFEYIQDYVNIYGLKIWQEEVSRIINYNVEQECNSFLKTKVEDWQSVYQSKAIPIPKYNPVDPISNNFIGRLAREILRVTDPRNTYYIDQLNTWYDMRTRDEVFHIAILSNVQEALDIFGLAGLDRLFSFMIVRYLQVFQIRMERLILKDKSLNTILNSASETLKPTKSLVANPGKFYPQLIGKFVKTWQTLLEPVLIVGQIQLLRRRIANQLNFTAKFESKHLTSALEALNASLIRDIQAHYKNPVLPYPTDENPLLFELNSYLETAGIGDPLSKIYTPTNQRLAPQVALYTALAVVNQSGRLVYTKSVAGLVAKRSNDAVDGGPLVVGCLSMLRQFHVDILEEFISYLGQFVRSAVDVSATASKVPELGSDIIAILAFVEEFIHYGHISRKLVENYIPGYIFDQFRTAVPLPNL